MIYWHVWFENDIMHFICTGGGGGGGGGGDLRKLGVSAQHERNKNDVFLALA